MLNDPQDQPVDRQEQVRVHLHGDYEHQTQVVENHDVARRGAVRRLAQLIWLFFGILVAGIGLRFALKLMATNPASPFDDLVYRFRDLFLWPFAGLTATPSAQGMVLEISALIAMFVYALLGWIVVRLVWLLFYQPAGRSVLNVERKYQ